MFGEVHGTNEVPELVSAVTYELGKEGPEFLWHWKCSIC